jgi:hypothetical protein
MPAFVFSWPIDPYRAAGSAKLYHCMASDVLVEDSRQRLENCSMSWLKIDLDDVGNCVPVCRGGDPRDTCRIEVYHSIK